MIIHLLTPEELLEQQRHERAEQFLETAEYEEGRDRWAEAQPAGADATDYEYLGSDEYEAAFDRWLRWVDADWTPGYDPEAEEVGS